MALTLELACQRGVTLNSVRQHGDFQPRTCTGKHFTFNKDPKAIENYFFGNENSSSISLAFGMCLNDPMSKYRVRTHDEQAPA